MADVSKKAKQITSMFAAYGQASDLRRIAVYKALLKDVPTDLLGVGIRRLMVTSKFLPTVAEIMEACKSITETVQGDKEVTWVEAWEEIERGIKKCGMYEMPKWSSPELKQLIGAVGWRNICCAGSGELTAMRGQMRRMWETLHKRQEDEKLNNYLLEQTNAGLQLQAVCKQLTERKIF